MAQPDQPYPTSSPDMPDEFDRLLGQLEGTLSTRPVPLQIVPLLGVGGSKTYVVRSFRESKPDDRDPDRTQVLYYISLQVTGRDGTVRLILPPKVADLIDRQRHTLQALAKRRQAKALAAARARAGLRPFVKKVQEPTG